MAQAIREAGTVAGEAEKVTSEVSVKAHRRRHSASYKLGILKKAEAAREEPGKVGELLRQEGLYGSHLTEWRRLQERGALQELGPKRRGPAPKVVDARIVELERENARLKARVEVAEALIEVQESLGDAGNRAGAEGTGRQRQEALMATIDEIGSSVGVAAACVALAVPKATYYRRKVPRPFWRPKRRPSPRQLTEAEGRAVLDALHEERFVNKAPAEIYATLLDEGQYLSSTRTMYLILDASGEVRERRDQVFSDN